MIFVDYGSKKETAFEVKKVIDSFSFCTYHYVYSQFQPWNKSKALNFVIKSLTSDYCFIADVDMIFHADFIQVLNEKSALNKVTYFQVGFLSQVQSTEIVDFKSHKTNFLTNKEATGMSLFPVDKLKLIAGYDEFFHCWGAEDTEIHNRLRKIGCEIDFYDKEVLLLHQWHKNYRANETKMLNKQLQLSGIVEINHQHLVYNLDNEIVKANDETWGKVISDEEFLELESFNKETIICNKKELINHFLYVELPQFKNGFLSVRFVEDDFQNTLKYKVKKIMGKKTPHYYSLKEINDELLLHIISFYHQYPYTFKINDDLKSINFKIKK